MSSFLNFTTSLWVRYHFHFVDGKAKTQPPAAGRVVYKCGVAICPRQMVVGPSLGAELWVESQESGVPLLHGLSPSFPVPPSRLLGRWWTFFRDPKASWGLGRGMCEVVGRIPTRSKQWYMCPPSVLLSKSPYSFKWGLTFHSGQSPPVPLFPLRWSYSGPQHSMAFMSHPSPQIRPDASKASRDWAHLKTDPLFLFVPILSFGSFLMVLVLRFPIWRTFSLMGKAKEK